MLGTTSLRAVVAACAAAWGMMAGVAHAVTADFDHYTVTYDDTVYIASDPGAITGSGGDSLGYEWFTWNLLSSGGAAKFTGLASPNTVIVPAVTITAKSGYVLSDFSLYFTGSQWGAGNVEFAAGPTVQTTPLANQVGDFTVSFADVSANNNAIGVSLLIPSYAYAREVGYRFSVSAVPEPETYAMLLAGLGMMGVIARRRKQQ